MKKKLLSKRELADSLELALERPYAVITFHPVTLENNSAEQQCNELLKALDMHPEMDYIITKANADADGRIINKMLDDYSLTHDNVSVYESLGAVRYLSAVKYSCMAIGNSSSGLVEVPSFKIPTVNIGDRQKGRLKAASVIDCGPKAEEISQSIERAQTIEFREICETVTNPYGDGDTSEKVVNAIETMMSSEIDLKKKFYDIESIKDD